MKWKIALLSAALCSPLNAMNPDGKGTLSADFGLGVLFPGSAVTYDALGGGFYVTEQEYAIKSIYSFGGTLTLPLFEPLSVLLRGSMMSVDVQGKFKQLAPTSGSYASRTETLASDLRGGLRLYPGVLWDGFEPDPLSNPDGPLYWPVMTLAYDARSARGQSSTDQGSGSFAGSASSSSLDQEYGGVFGELLLPVAPFLSLNASFERELSQRVAYRSDTYKFSDSKPGDYEAYRAGIDLFVRVRTLAENEMDSFLPHVGFPGQAKLSLSYGQDFRPGILGPVSSRIYALKCAYALNGAWGLDLGLQVVENGPSSYNKAADYTVKRDDRSIGILYFGLSYAWGSLKRNAPQTLEVEE